MRWRALAQTRVTSRRRTPAASGSPRTARIATARIGPKDPVVWSLKAIGHRRAGRTSAPILGSPRGAASAARTRIVEAVHRGQRRALDVAEQTGAAGSSA